MTKRMVLLAVAAALALGSCSSGGGGDDEGAAMVSEDSSAAPAAESEGKNVGVGTAAGAGGASDAFTAVPASVGLPRVVRTATIRLEVGDGAFGDAFSKVATIASSKGGFVASSTSAAGGDDELASGSLVVRVPAEHFDTVRSELRRLGELRGEELKGEDVDAQLTDLDARIRNLRAQEETIRLLMAKAADVPQTLQVQGQLSAVREQIEQLSGQQARLTDAVSFATLTVEISEPGAAASAKDPSRLAKAWRTALDGAEATVAAMVVALGFAAPLVAIALVLYGVARLTWWRRPASRTAD